MTGHVYQLIILYCAVLYGTEKNYQTNRKKNRKVEKKLPKYWFFFPLKLGNGYLFSPQRMYKKKKAHQLSLSSIPFYGTFDLQQKPHQFSMKPKFILSQRSRKEKNLIIVSIRTKCSGSEWNVCNVEMWSRIAWNWCRENWK